MIWNTIKCLMCTAASDPRYEAYLSNNPVTFVVSGKPENRHWVIGPYEGLKRLARDLRVDAAARATFSRACFGGRHIDLPPAGPQPSGGFRKGMESAVPRPINRR